MTTTKMWMVRAGQGGSYVDDFIENNLVAIGWGQIGTLTKDDSKKSISSKISKEWPNITKGKVSISTGMVYRFINEIEIGDKVVTYDPSRRIYHVGKISSNATFDKSIIEDLPRVRKVKWIGEVHRDTINTSTKNTLGAISTLFLLSPDATKELEDRLAGKQVITKVDPVEAVEEIENLARDLRAQSRELIKDQITRLDWEEMQELVAGLLRAMGYKTRISAAGPDRGKDIIASPDGFGFEQPRIVVEVKHRPGTTMGAPELRTFLGGRHTDDKGLYVSTGGFTKEARYEADRASIPLALLDLDSLVKEIIRHYSEMDVEAKSLIPLTNIYWPV